MATATAFGLTGCYDLGRLGLLPAVLADTDAEEIARRYVEPLGTGAAMLPILETVRRYLTLGMRADLTAEHMSVHHNTVRFARLPLTTVQQWVYTARQRGNMPRGSKGKPG